MIKYIADIQGNEPDILEDVKNEPLKIFDGNKIVKIKEAPFEGWTNDLLFKTNDQIISLLNNEVPLDSYLSTQWVGSTEV